MVECGGNQKWEQRQHEALTHEHEHFHITHNHNPMRRL